MFKKRFINQLIKSFFDLSPILAVVISFQVLIIRQSIPDVSHFMIGILFVLVGLTLFIQGLELSLFPLGESMAYAFARKGSLFWLLTFAFCLGFGAAIAEPALIHIAQQAAELAAKKSLISPSLDTKNSYALGFRMIVAVSIGLAILVGVLRIIKGWPAHYPVFYAYALIALLTPFAPTDILGIAYDSGCIATSTITVPLVTALGVGLATAIKGRNPMTDGFGLLVFASLTPIISVMLYGIIV